MMKIDTQMLFMVVSVLLAGAVSFTHARAASYYGTPTSSITGSQESGTTYYSVNGQTFVVHQEPLPAVPYRETYPGIEKKWTWLDTLLFGDPQIKIDCKNPINRFDPRCRHDAPSDNGTPNVEQKSPPDE